jgi:3-ketosteroid 9alpha-monooxygenase subunit A
VPGAVGPHAPCTHHMGHPKGPVEGRIVTTYHGIGLAAGHIQSFDRVFTLSATTPIDRHTVEARKMAVRWW